MRYGVPYQGSKNSIATKIISFLPSAESFMTYLRVGVR